MSRGSVPQITPPCEEISMTAPTWIRRPFARTPPHLVTLSPCHLVIRSAPLLGPTDRTDTDEASDGSEGFIDGAGI
jgi:hypothetical protein